MSKIWFRHPFFFKQALLRFGLIRSDNTGIQNLHLHDLSYNYLLKQDNYMKIIHEYEQKPPSKELPQKKIWIYWDGNLAQAPDLVRLCISQAQRIFSEYLVTIVNQETIQQYVEIPSPILEMYKNGQISHAHFSDILRAELLIKHGGIWMDSTVFCSDRTFVDSMMESPFFVFKEISLDKRMDQKTVASSWFIVSGKNSNILSLTRDLIYEYWKNNSRLIDYFLFHICFKIATDVFSSEWESIPTYNNVSPHMLQFELLKKYTSERFSKLMSFSSVHKLDRRLESQGEEYTNYDYLMEHYDHEL